MNSPMYRRVSLLLLIAGLAACGNKGPLTRPPSASITAPVAVQAVATAHASTQAEGVL
jgi:predicted small lipoprotein YifL